MKKFPVKPVEMPVSKGEQYETKKGELPEGGSIDKDLVRFLVVKRR